MATTDEETEHLLQLYRADGPAIMSMLNGQLAILANRSQTLLSLAGITITVTGFSGANIARTGRVAAILLCSGLVLVMVSAAFAIAGILAVEWISSTPPVPLADAVRLGLRRRDEKTRRYRWSTGFLVVGMSLYVSSVVLLLLGNLPP
ncbi:MAG: hypothetical protein WCJ30_00375 [Deltaproteobacteria bacterium]